MAGWYRTSFLSRVANDARAEALLRRGVSEDVIAHIGGLDSEAAQFVTNYAMRSPQASLDEIRGVALPQKQDVYTPYEYSVTSSALPEVYRRWGLIQMKKMRRVGQGGVIDYPYSEEQWMGIFNDVLSWANGNTVDLKPFSLEIALQKAQEWRSLNDKIVYGPEWKNPKFNGYTIRKIETAEGLKYEGRENANCVGSNFLVNVLDGQFDIYSVRDPQNKPLVTLRTSGGSFAFQEAKAFSNNPVKDRAVALMISEWMGGIPETSFESTGYGEQSDFKTKQKAFSLRDTRPDKMDEKLEEWFKDLEYSKTTLNSVPDIALQTKLTSTETPFLVRDQKIRDMYVFMLREVYKKKSGDPEKFFTWLDSMVNAYIDGAAKYDLAKIEMMVKKNPFATESAKGWVRKTEIDLTSTAPDLSPGAVNVRAAAINKALAIPFIAEMLRTFTSKHPEVMSYGPQRRDYDSYGQYAQNVQRHLSREGYGAPSFFPDQSMLSYEFESAMAHKLMEVLGNTAYRQRVTAYIEQGV